MKITTPLFFFMIIVITSNVSATGLFDIMNETIYAGDWDVDSENYVAPTLPPSDGAWKRGRIWVITSVSKNNPDYKDQYMYRIYATEYSDCVYKGRDEFGTTRCAGDGCWVESIMGNDFFVTESLYNRQSNDTKQLIDAGCGGVVLYEWEPFQGDPANPYDVSVNHDDVIWGYVDIGFRNLSKMNGNFCIQSNDSVHVDAGSWDEIFSDHYDKDGEWCQHRWDISDESGYKVVDGNVSGVVDIVVEWAHKMRDTEGDTRYWNHTNTATFSETKTMPTLLNKTPEIRINITSYNNSVTPYSLIDVRITDNITSTEVVYRNASSVHHHKIGFHVIDDDGEYFDFVNESTWIPDESNIVALRDGYYVINEAPLKLSELHINVSTPYDTYEIADYNTTVINSKPSDYIQWEVMGVFLAFIVLCIVMAYRATRGFRL